MKRILKWFAGIVLLGVLMFSFVGCVSPENAVQASSDFSTNGSIICVEQIPLTSTIRIFVLRDTLGGCDYLFVTDHGGNFSAICELKGREYFQVEKQPCEKPWLWEY